MFDVAVDLRTFSTGSLWTLDSRACGADVIKIDPVGGDEACEERCAGSYA